MRKILAGLAVLLWGMGLVSSVIAADTNSPSPPQDQVAAKIDRTIGVCHLVNSLGVSGRDDPQSTVYVIAPRHTASGYFSQFENKHISYEKNVKHTLLQGAEHGELKEEEEQYYRYTPVADYIGADRATFLVEIGGLKVKVVYHFKVIDGGAIGGTEGQDKENCPKGWLWKMPPTNLNK